VVRYRGIFSNTQVDYTDNSPNEQDVYVLITDATQLYDMAYTEVAVGGGNTEYTFTFSGLPATATALVFSYTNDGGVSWANYGPVAPTSPVVFELPDTADRQFIVYVQRTDGSDTIDMTEITTVDFELSAQPAVQRVVDNDEDKYTPIRSKQMEIQAHTSDEFSILNFKGGTDNQFKVEIAIGTETDIMFTGWLSVSDLRQRFQPHPNVLVLTATDGLGFLKDIDLTDISGEQFTDENKIIEYIAACLYGTGLQLPIEVEMNIMESTAPLAPSGHMYNFCYLHALTYEKNIGEFDDCYTVLKKIIGENSYLSQEKNRWYIKRVDEYDNHDPVSVTFAYDGSTVETSYFELYKKEIGSNSLLYSLAWMNEDAELSLLSAHKEVKHVYNYERPNEIPCNKSFERGDLIGDDGTETVDDIEYTRKKYELDCWDKRWSSITGDQAATIDIEVKRLFTDLDYEDSRYVNIPQETTGKFHFIMSKKIQCIAGDKMDIDLSISLAADQGGSAFKDQVLQVRLYANDGTYWTHHGKEDDADEPLWRECAAGFEIDDLDIEFYNLYWGDTDQTQQASLFSGETAPFPRDGYIKICVFQSNLFRADTDTHIHKVDFTYNAKINGTFNKYDGHYFKSTQDTLSKFKREEQVYISDIGHPQFKGFIFKSTWIGLFTGEAVFSGSNGFTIDGDKTTEYSVGQRIKITGTTANNMETTITSVTYSVVDDSTTIGVTGTTTAATEAATVIQIEGFTKCDGFFNYAVFPSGPPSADYIKPFGAIQNQDVWNQYNRTFAMFEGTIDGLDTDKQDGAGLPDIPGFIHTYYLKDSHELTNNKKFMPLHFEQDLYMCEWDTVLVEVFDTTIEKNYLGQEFKYIESDT
jgi:hypothetical protein